MTGNSWSWKYNRKIISGLLIVGGLFLLMEHLFSFSGFDIEILGHEWYGLGMILAGIGISMKWNQWGALLRAIKARDWRAIIDEGERRKYE